MLKKVLVPLLAFTIIFSTIGVNISFAETNETTDDSEIVVDQQGNVIVEGMGSEYTENESLEIIDNVDVMDKYISEQDGVLVIDPAAKTEVDELVYSHYAKGVETINTLVEDENYVLDDETKTIVDPDSDQPSIEQGSDQGDFVTLSSTSKYWWGVKWYLSKKEANKWQNKFSDYSFGWSVIAGVAGSIGAPAASVSAIIMAAGNYYFYKELRDNTSSKGSVLVFKWAPPKAYAYKR